MKDNRKTYNHQEVEVNGTIIRFDGKGNPDNKQLMVYRYYGDINLMEEAMQNFALDNGYEEVLLKC